MSNYLNIPLISPFKMLPHTTTPGMHFDDDWAYKQIKSFDLDRRYQQKWIRSVTTKMQIISTIEPSYYVLYDINRTPTKTFSWSVAGIGSNGEKAWECTIDFTDVLTDGVYFLYQKNELLSVKFEAISEPIHLKDSWPECLVFKYKNSYNDQGVIFTTNIEYTFICEALITQYRFKKDQNNFIDQPRNVKSLSGTPYRNAKLYIGELTGHRIGGGAKVAPYILDIINRIFICDHVMIGKPTGGFLQYSAVPGSEVEVLEANGYPLVGGSLEITPSKNVSSLQFTDEVDLAPGIVIAYNLDTLFFGTSNIVSITDIEQS